jgi:hypothetical protein
VSGPVGHDVQQSPRNPAPIDNPRPRQLRVIAQSRAQSPEVAATDRGNEGDCASAASFGNSPRFPLSTGRPLLPGDSGSWKPTEPSSCGPLRRLRQTCGSGSSAQRLSGSAARQARA